MVSMQPLCARDETKNGERIKVTHMIGSRHVPQHIFMFVEGSYMLYLADETRACLCGSYPANVGTTPPPAAVRGWGEVYHWGTSM